MDSNIERIKKDRQDQLRKIYSVCCFSASNQINLMWSHYAESNTGFCIEYDFKSEGLTAEDIQLMFPVLYKEDARIMVNNIDRVDTSDLMHAATVKEINWQYEQEWRHIFLGNNIGPQHMPTPTAIYLGAKVSAQNQSWMIEFCRKHQIPLYRMDYDPKMNKLEPASVSI